MTDPEMTRYFMTIQEAGWLILDAVAIGVAWFQRNFQCQRILTNHVNKLLIVIVNNSFLGDQNGVALRVGNQVDIHKHAGLQQPSAIGDTNRHAHHAAGRIDHRTHAVNFTGKLVFRERFGKNLRALAGFGGFLLVGNTGVVHLQLGQPFLFPSIAAVAVGGTLLSGGKGSYWGTMAGAIVLTLITSLLTTMQMPDSVRRMVLGATLLILISIYGRQQALRQ